jgi:hypothetical protein
LFSITTQTNALGAFVVADAFPMLRVFHRWLTAAVENAPALRGVYENFLALDGYRECLQLILFQPAPL